MSETISNHPIKTTIATAVVVVIAIISFSYKTGIDDAQTNNRVQSLEDKFIEYELKEVPTMKIILERVDENVKKIIDNKL